jgi:4-oxalocrotonate tautomerase
VPVVTVELWEGRSLEQKRKLVKAITDAMVEHAAARPDALHVIIHESTKENWGRAGVLGVDRQDV